MIFYYIKDPSKVGGIGRPPRPRKSGVGQDDRRRSKVRKSLIFYYITHIFQKGYRLQLFSDTAISFEPNVHYFKRNIKSFDQIQDVDLGVMMNFFLLDCQIQIYRHFLLKENSVLSDPVTFKVNLQ